MMELKCNSAAALLNIYNTFYMVIKNYVGVQGKWWMITNVACEHTNEWDILFSIRILEKAARLPNDQIKLEISLFP